MEWKRILSKSLSKTEYQHQTACEEEACAARKRMEVRTQPAYIHLPDAPIYLYGFRGPLMVVVAGRAGICSAPWVSSRVLKGLAAAAPSAPPCL